jgi:hypothetical protein
MHGPILVSILTLEGRALIPYTGYDRHVALIQRGARSGAAKLWHDKLTSGSSCW